jgi:hypothetical protein
MTIDSASRGLRPLAEQMINLHNAAVSIYGAMVDDVLSGQITEERKIEDIMDGLLNYGDYPDCVELYRKLGHFAAQKYPELVSEHFALFRELYGDGPNIGSL